MRYTTAIIGVALFIALFTAVVVWVGTNERPAVTELVQLVQVETAYGETYVVSATHRCGPTAFKKAAVHAFDTQSGKLRDMPWHPALAIAVMSDWTRIFNGDVKNRCEMKHIKVEFISERIVAGKPNDPKSIK